MNRKHIALAASSCALAFGLFACGDDVIMVNKSENYLTVDKIEDVECNDESEGSMAFEKSTATMYVCSEGKWVTISAQESIQQRCSAEALKDSSGYKFICDGEVIATVTNGAKGDKGEDGADINADSVVKAVYDSVYKDLYKASLDTINKTVTEKVDAAVSSASAQITEDLTEKLACKVADQSTDEDKGIMTVTVNCGGATSEFDFPVLVPNKNLDVVYNKSVFVRFPALSGSCEEDGRVFQKMSSSAMLHIMEVDESFNATGKGFSSELILKKDENELQSYNTVTGNETEVCAYLLRMQGDFSITNMMNSYAKLTTTIALPASVGSVTNFTFSALVDMDASDTIVLDFLSDYKAARIQNLLKSESFDDASKQANSELAVAFGLDKDAAAFDHVISSKLSQEELEVMTLLPGALMNAYIGGTYYSANLIVYNGYKKLFAENGDFKTVLDEKITLSNDLNSSVVKGYNNESAKFLVDFLFNTGFYDVHKKFVQTGFIDAYSLPACEEDEIKDVESEGYFKAFKCISKEAIWTPVDYESKWSVSDDELNQDDLVLVLGACAAANVGEVKTTDEAELVNSSYTGNNSFKCVSRTSENENGEKETKYLWVHADALDAELGEVCLEDIYGKIKVHPKTEIEYICTDRGWVKNNVEEYCAFNYKNDSFYMVDWAAENKWDLVATCNYKNVNYVSPDSDLKPSSSSSHWSDGAAACTHVYGECSNTNTSASSTCIYVYGTEDVGTKKQNLNALYLCEDVEGETYGNWVEAESELAFCTAQVKHKKQRDPRDGDVCLLPKMNKVFLDGYLVGEVSLDGFCTKEATKIDVNGEPGEQAIPDPYVCFAVDENRADPYATLFVGEVKTEWVRKTAAQACDYVNPTAVAGQTCNNLLGKNIKTPQVKTIAGNWEDDTTVQAKCALQVTNNGTVAAESDATCTLNDENQNEVEYVLDDENNWVVKSI